MDEIIRFFEGVLRDYTPGNNPQMERALHVAQGAKTLVGATLAFAKHVDEEKHCSFSNACIYYSEWRRAIDGYHARCGNLPQAVR